VIFSSAFVSATSPEIVFIFYTSLCPLHPIGGSLLAEINKNLK
jgi:hypothetical protein